MKTAFQVHRTSSKHIKNVQSDIHRNSDIIE